MKPGDGVALVRALDRVRYAHYDLEGARIMAKYVPATEDELRIAARREVLDVAEAELRSVLERIAEP